MIDHHLHHITTGSFSNFARRACYPASYLVLPPPGFSAAIHVRDHRIFSDVIADCVNGSKVVRIPGYVGVRRGGRGMGVRWKGGGNGKKWEWSGVGLRESTHK